MSGASPLGRMAKVCGARPWPDHASPRSAGRGDEATTEIVHALGFGDDLVGRWHECDHPPGVERLPVVTEPKLRLGGGSGAIDRRVRKVLEQALSVYVVNVDGCAASPRT